MIFGRTDISVRASHGDQDHMAKDDDFSSFNINLHPVRPGDFFIDQCNVVDEVALNSVFVFSGPVNSITLAKS